VRIYHEKVMRSICNSRKCPYFIWDLLRQGARKSVISVGFLILYYKNTIISYERASNWPFYFVFNSVRTFFKTKRSIDMKLQLRTVAASVAILLAPMVVSSNAFAADDVLMDKSGMTLYTFDKDSKGQSNCNDGCAVKWPPFVANQGAKAKSGFGVIKRDDGTQQWTYKNKPLYTWSGDIEQGDMNGDGLGGVWHVAKKVASVY
jgi:predicted lipoprotein with Yx(FWY)xxD motif